MASELPGQLLLVDDDVDILMVLPIALQHLGAEFTTASSGELALTKVNDNDYSAVILDVDLGIMNGFEVARRIRRTERGRNTPILFVTGNSCDARSCSLGYQSGGVDYLFKPVDLDVLTAKLRVFLALDQELRQVSQRNEELTREVAASVRALTEAKVLRGMLAICAYCHRIRDGAQSWQALEAYISRHSDAKFSHGICPTCFDLHLRSELEQLSKLDATDGSHPRNTD